MELGKTWKKISRNPSQALPAPSPTPWPPPVTEVGEQTDHGLALPATTPQRWGPNTHLPGRRERGSRPRTACRRARAGCTREGRGGGGHSGWLRLCLLTSTWAYHTSAPGEVPASGHGLHGCGAAGRGTVCWSASSRHSVALRQPFCRSCGSPDPSFGGLSLEPAGDRTLGSRRGTKSLWGRGTHSWRCSLKPPPPVLPMTSSVPASLSRMPICLKKIA